MEDGIIDHPILVVPNPSDTISMGHESLALLQLYEDTPLTHGHGQLDTRTLLKKTHSASLHRCNLASSGSDASVDLRSCVKLFNKRNRLEAGNKEIPDKLTSKIRQSLAGKTHYFDSAMASRASC